MKKQRLIWMADETIMDALPNDWRLISSFMRQLINLIGNKKFEHEVIDPRECWLRLVPQLQGKSFKTVIDLTGWLSPSLQELFPDADIINDFSLSRIREVSSSELRTSGHRISLTADQLRRRKLTLDLSDTLIIDDTGFSGSTNEITMEAWGLDPTKTSHAFLIANEGSLPTKDGFLPGAVERLANLGSKVFWGTNIRTPEDDGWHIKDLYEHPNLEKSVGISLKIQALAEREDVEGINDLFQAHNTQETLFPERMTTQQLNALRDEGRMHGNRELDTQTVHARNPLLWAIPSFHEDIDLPGISNHRDEVMLLLSGLRALTRNPEGRNAAMAELSRETRIVMQSGPEGLRIGKEGR